MKSEVQLERKARRFWVSLIVCLLGFQVGLGVVAITLATNDESVAIVPDYHHAALNWDQVSRERSAAERLGLSIEIAPSDVIDLNGQRAVVVNVVDRHGEPVTALALTLSTYHHAHANHGIELALTPSQASYVALGPLTRAGLWQFDLKFDYAGERVHTVHTQEL